MDNFNQLVFAPRTAATKNARNKLWDKVCGALGVANYPVSPENILAVAAVLREAGYRCGYLYLVEAKQVHVRLGYSITPQIELALADAKRALERGQGGPTRSAEIRPQWFDQLVACCGADQIRLSREPHQPSGGAHIWGIGSGWLLREIELANLDLHIDTIDFGDDGSTATLRVAASKVDIKGKTVARTHKCICNGRQLVSCPVCSLRMVFDEAMLRWGGDRASDLAKFIPLVSTVRDHREVVSKACVVEAARADARKIHDLGIASLAAEDVTWHFMRRSGAKDLARRGVPLSRVQWFGRWGSPTVLAYVEEALEESPELRGMEASWDEIRADLAEVLRAIRPTNDGSADFSAAVEGQAARDAGRTLGWSEDQYQQVRELAMDVSKAKVDIDEIYEFVKPTTVKCSSSSLIHVCEWLDKSTVGQWTTLCGWKWAASRAAKPISPLLVDLAEVCEKCARCGGVDIIKERVEEKKLVEKKRLNDIGLVGIDTDSEDDFGLA